MTIENVREDGALNVYTGNDAFQASAVSETLVRVNYSETDQMGVVYHARYLVWLDIARCDYLRQCGMTYRELEAAGLRLAVSDVSIKYRQPARWFIFHYNKYRKTNNNEETDKTKR